MPTFVMRERPSGRKLKDPLDVYKKLKKLANAAQESYWILGLDTANREILRKCVFIGGPRSVNNYCVPIFRWLMEVGATAWIGIHNHPSGSLNPSEYDRKLRKKFKTASEFIDVTMHDQMIISEDGYFSFNEEDRTGCGIRSFKGKPSGKSEGEYHERFMKKFFVPYLNIKEKYPATLLFFESGDHFTLYFDDAKTASKMLEIPFTEMMVYDRYKMATCTIKIENKRSSIDKLLKAGWPVAICAREDNSKKRKSSSTNPKAIDLQKWRSERK